MLCWNLNKQHQLEYSYPNNSTTSEWWLNRIYQSNKLKKDHVPRILQFSPKIRFLCQRVWSVARGRTDRHESENRGHPFRTIFKCSFNLSSRSGPISFWPWTLVREHRHKWLWQLEWKIWNSINICICYLNLILCSLAYDMHHVVVWICWLMSLNLWLLNLDVYFS